MSNQAFTILESIASTASKNEKIELLKKGFADCPTLRRICLAAYDPFKTYGIAKIPPFTPMDTYSLDMDSPMVWETIDRLASRELTGTAAIDSVAAILTVMPDSSRELFKRVLLRDLRAGFSENTINKAEKGAIKTFPYMRCSLEPDSNMGKWDWADGVIVQLKADGMFNNITRGLDGEVWFTTRSGTPLPIETPQMQALADQAVKLLANNTQSHGELTVYRNGQLLSRKEGNGLLNSVISDGEKLGAEYTIVADLWDQIPLSAVVPKGKYETPYKERLSSLLRQLKVSQEDTKLLRLIDTKVVRSRAEAFALYKGYLAQGMEGVICKSPATVWKDGTSKDQVKLKLEFEVELEVYGFEPGTPGTKTEATFGSLKCKSSDGLLLVDVSGFTDALRAEIHNSREEWTGAIITVRANDVIDRETDNIKSLFLPRFVERRLDKSEADDLAKIEATKKAAVEA
ncbi:hypothetical protein ATN89_17325 [Comamonas thiooxydans]|uniref:ATP-dependent DNA ligase n=1 Tax=Comamonas thiooxydans TaxID=363952 RepID=UPI0007C593CA|nr:hypothetical protein [Comamonas thiooxydans]OAD82845.1 hypothetical protein ATN89_17325 [Comamonas thiooxydans]